MSEWLTTGEMIDSLEVGEVALSKQGFIVTRNEYGGIVPENNPRENVILNGAVVKEKWRILTKKGDSHAS